MPKIIENLKVRLVEEARLQTLQRGYSSVTIRSVASACGVGVGTVYNYFPSKDMLLATFILEDWRKCLCVIQQSARDTNAAEDVLRCMYDQLTSFIQLHSSVFSDREAASHFGKTMGNYHSLLRQQLSEPLRKYCADGFTADFIAEAMLAWTVQQVPFEQLLPLLRKLL